MRRTLAVIGKYLLVASAAVCVTGLVVGLAPTFALSLPNPAARGRALTVVGYAGLLVALVAAYERLEHPQRGQLRHRFEQWPKGTSVVLEASFGWGWLSDIMVEAGIDVQLSNCFKGEKMRKARGIVELRSLSIWAARTGRDRVAADVNSGRHSVRYAHK